MGALHSTTSPIRSTKKRGKKVLSERGSFRFDVSQLGQRFSTHVQRCRTLNDQVQNSGRALTSLFPGIAAYHGVSLSSAKGFFFWGDETERQGPHTRFQELSLTGPLFIQLAHFSLFPY